MSKREESTTWNEHLSVQTLARMQLGKRSKGAVLCSRRTMLQLDKKRRELRQERNWIQTACLWPPNFNCSFWDKSLTVSDCHIVSFSNENRICLISLGNRPMCTALNSAFSLSISHTQKRIKLENEKSTQLIQNCLFVFTFLAKCQQHISNRISSKKPIDFIYLKIYKIFWIP